MTEIEVTLDGCPDDPAKTEPGICGCGIPDTDSAGDSLNPDKTETDVCGCDQSDKDTDGDGILNCEDECPTDPNKSDPGICGCWKSDADIDGNGICPDTYTITPDLRIKAVIRTEDKGPIDAVWQKGGQGQTAGGHEVVWGYFYADPEIVNWGSPENPDLLVKIWFDAGGRLDVNFFHVSVPEIEVFAEYEGRALEGRNHDDQTIRPTVLRSGREGRQRGKARGRRDARRVSVRRQSACIRDHQRSEHRSGHQHGRRPDKRRVAERRQFPHRGL